MSTIVSIDYGTKRIGLAFCDPDRIFAFPIGYIENNNLKHSVESIIEIIKDKEASLILVGMPYNMDNTKGEMVKKVENFISEIKKNTNVEIKTIDERLSSFQAEENLREAGLNSKQIKEKVDAEAARVLLVEYLANNS